MDPAAPGAIGYAIFKGSAIILAMLIMAYPFYRVMSLWIEHTLTAGEAAIYLTVLLLLFAGIIAGWGTFVGWMALFGLIFASLGLPLINRVADKIALRRLEDEDIQEFSAMLREQPGNVYLHERLARIFLGRKEFELALSHVKQALEYAPKDPGLMRLQERIETEQRREELRLKICPKCGAENPPETGACLQCGFRFVDLGDLLRMLWTRPALEAFKWTGLGLLGAGLVLLTLSTAIWLSGMFVLMGIVCLFWHMYGHFSQM